MKKLIVFSGTQPSGNLTLGNYIGSIQQWKNMQNTYECMFCVADLHAITISQNPKKLCKNSMNFLAMYLSCGVDPLQSTLFFQSHVPEHNQLFWLLNCHSYFGELNRMTQFKSKFFSLKKHVSVGLFNYPILMSADILLYQSNKIPVGKDQMQHLELTRRIAKRFNALYGNLFVIPEPILSKNSSKVMSLLHPWKKMSKSDLNQDNVIFLFEDSKSIFRKIRRATTDSDNPPIIRFDPLKKPGISNLLNILSSLTDTSMHDLEKFFFKKTYMDLKNVVSDVVSKKLSDLQKNYRIFRSDENYLKDIFVNGSEKARKKASCTLKKVYNAMGLIRNF